MISYARTTGINNHTYRHTDRHTVIQDAIRKCTNSLLSLRNPEPGNHSFAGIASAFPSKPPRSQTEVLNFRDRTLGGALDASHGGSRAKGRGHGKEWEQHRQFGASCADRSLEETASLREQLCQVFAGQDNMVALVLQCHPAETDINVLSDLILEQQKDQTSFSLNSDLNAKICPGLIIVFAKATTRNHTGLLLICINKGFMKRPTFC